MTGEALLRRQLQVTALALLVVLAVWAFTGTQGAAPAAAAHGPVDVYVKAHHPPDAGSLRLAYVQLFVTAAVALVVLGHGARVVAYVFRNEVN